MMNVRLQRVDPLELPMGGRRPRILHARRLEWRPAVPRLSAALPATLGLLCLLLAFKASLRFSGDFFFRANAADIASARAAEARSASSGDAVVPPGSPAPCDAEGSGPPPSDRSVPGGPSTGCGEGPAQLPVVATLDLRAGSPVSTHHPQGAVAPRCEADSSSPRLSGRVAWAAEITPPLPAGTAPFLPRAPPVA